MDVEQHDGQSQLLLPKPAKIWQEVAESRSATTVLPVAWRGKASERAPRLCVKPATHIDVIGRWCDMALGGEGRGRGGERERCTETLHSSGCRGTYIMGVAPCHLMLLLYYFLPSSTSASSSPSSLSKVCPLHHDYAKSVCQ